MSRTRHAPRLVVLLGALALLPAARADDPPGKPQAPPPMPYRTAAEVEARLRELARPPAEATAPSRGLTEYGRSAAGKPLLVLRIGAATNPVVLVHGGLGARDAAGTAACLDLAERILGGEIATLESVSYALIPAPNPDALDAFLAGKPRAGGIDVDRDRDDRRGEDGPDDADKDGEILRMRRASVRGTLTVEDTPAKDGKVFADPRLLVEKGVDVRRPTSYEVFDEGLDDDGDGDVNEDPRGLDLSRQMAGAFEGTAPWRGDGPFPGAAPEAKALMDVSYGITNLLAWYGFTSEGPAILRAGDQAKVADFDDPLYGKIAEDLKTATSLEVRKASDVPGRAANPGSDLDWASVHLTVPAFRIPVWRIPKEEGSGRERKDPDELDWLLWNDRVLGGHGFVPWKPFDHRTLGKVEIGGWKRFTRYEPPKEFLGNAVRAVSGAPLVHAKFRPVLEPDLLVEAAGEGVWRVTLRARNRGEAPTETASAVKRSRPFPVRATFTAAGDVRVLGGPVAADFGAIEAGAVSGEATWLVRRTGAGALGTVKIRHRMTGEIAAEVRTP